MPPRKSRQDLDCKSVFDRVAPTEAARQLDRFCGPGAVHACVSSALTALRDGRPKDAKFWLDVLRVLPAKATRPEDTADLILLGQVPPQLAAKILHQLFGDLAGFEVRGLIDHAAEQDWPDDVVYWTSVLTEMAQGRVH